MKTVVNKQIQQLNLFDMFTQVIEPIKNMKKINPLDKLKPNRKAKVLEEYEDIVKDLRDSYARHKIILKSGSGDIFHADGMNLFLVRNHIIYYKNQLTELNEKYELELPQEYYFDIPEKYPMDFSVKASISRHTFPSSSKTYTEEELRAWREQLS